MAAQSTSHSLSVTRGRQLACPETSPKSSPRSIASGIDVPVSSRTRKKRANVTTRIAGIAKKWRMRRKPRNNTRANSTPGTQSIRTSCRISAGRLNRVSGASAITPKEPCTSNHPVPAKNPPTTG
jgi:hypothetical protein